MGKNRFRYLTVGDKNRKILLIIRILPHISIKNKTLGDLSEEIYQKWNIQQLANSAENKGICYGVKNKPSYTL
jgi:hypothetical protein